MSKNTLAFFFYVVVLSCAQVSAKGQSAHDAELVHWLDSDLVAFEKARLENKPVILYLEAIWCHWCHVMDQQTYANAEVADLLNEHFVTLRIDQDARPDLANRYRDYGWPATIFFTPNGVDMVKRAGFISPENMQRLLRAIIKDPSPEAAAVIDLPVVTSGALMSEKVRLELQRRHQNTYDLNKGGLKAAQKFLERDSVEYSLWLAAGGNAEEKRRAVQTLDAALNLLDPVWGGAYQYSTGYVWHKQHYEKLARIQAAYLRIYSLAYAQLEHERYLSATNNIVSYLQQFLLSDSGAFYTSQDADVIPGQHALEYFALDDGQRRKQGLPVINQSIYASDNGALIEALALSYELSGNREHLTLAKNSVSWILSNRRSRSGGFHHDEGDSRLYLADNLSMGRGLLALYRATAERSWLDAALGTIHVIDKRFEFPSGGYASAEATGSPVLPIPQLDENISLARFANLLSQISADPVAGKVSRRTMVYLGNKSVALRRLTEAGILLAEHEHRSSPLHLTVVGGKQNAKAKVLFATASNLPVWYKRVEWWDRNEGPLVNPDVTYPELTQAAIFVCTDSVCSVPLYSVEKTLTFLGLQN